MSERLGVGIVGCGTIAGPYAEDAGRQPHVRLVGVTDVDPARARALGTRHGLRTFDDLDTMLDDPEITAIANLTPHRVHASVTRRALEAGRHVFSEKPMAVTAADAVELVALAEHAGLILGAAPIVAMGELAQTARRWIDDGRLGTVRLAYADVNWGRIETWHPSPESFYEIGPLYDVGIYPITLLTGLFGPVVHVTADARVLLRERRAQDGQPFEPGAPDYVVASLEHASGPMTRLTVDFYVADPARQRGVELHGDLGSLWLSNWFQFGGTLEHAPWGEPYGPVPLLREPEVVMPWAAGLEELALAGLEGRAPRNGGAHAAHVIDVIETTLRAAAEGRELAVDSRFEAPPPMGWAQAVQI